MWPFLMLTRTLKRRVIQDDQQSRALGGWQ